MNPVRVAIVGCGAVTEKFYLPALARSPLLRIAALVDVSLARAERLAPARESSSRETIETWSLRRKRQ